MKKFLLLASIIFSTGVFAGPVSKNQAKSIAQDFLVERNPKAVLKSEPNRAAKKVKGIEADDEAYYYIFNTEGNNGFVIVSGDDRTPAVLGYSDEGSFDVERIPSNMKYWLSCYEEQLEALSQMNDTEAARVLSVSRKAPKATRNSIAPLITTKWDQATPYWNECPQFMISDNEEDGYELAYTGCVATAMSQIMYFYKQPEETLAEIPSYSFSYSDGSYNYSTVTMDALPKTTLDWEHMRETYTGAEDEVYTTAVAHLMFYVGCSVKMQYGTSSSGAYTDDIPAGFKYFGYGSKLAFRTDYTQEAWDDLVYSELAAGRPMIYNGTAGSGGGHSFICDGFEYGDYFHINWGWGGMGNGYFQLSILNPSASGIGGSSSSEGYNMKQNIVYNLIPNTATPDGSSGDDEEDEPVLTVTAISGPSAAFERDKLSDPFKIYKSRIVKVSYSDHSGTGKKFKEALALYNLSEDTYTIVTNSESSSYYKVTTSADGVTTSYGSGINSNAQNVLKFGAGLTGNYRLVPMYQVEGSEDWKPMKESDRFYLDMTLTNYSASFISHPVIDLEVTDWKFTGGEKVGVREQVTATIKNNSSDRFFGDLYLDFGGQQIDEYSQYTTVVQAEVLAGQSSDVTFNVSPSSAGTKTVKVMRLDNYGSYVSLSESGSVTISAGEEAEELNLSVVIEATNASEAEDSYTHGTIYDSHASFKATITNNADGEYNKYVLAPLFIVKRNEDGSINGGSMVTYKQQSLSLAKGESKTLYFDFDNLAYGSTYSMNIYARNYVADSEEGSHLENIVKSGESKYYVIEPGIITWTGDGTRNGYKPVDNFQVPATVAAVSLEGLSISRIVANDNPNTLYFLDADQNIPEGLDGKNVLKGQVASNISLTDGYDFYTPQTFTADAITYQRIFTQGHGNTKDGWSTIVLPFAAEKATVESVEKKWFTSSTDAGKHFWIYDFAQEDGETVYFRHAAQPLEANRPYIIAVPDDTWGSAWDLRNKPMVFSASNVTIKPNAVAYTSGDNFLFAGTYAEQSLNSILALNEAGSKFALSTSEQTVPAFHAYYQYINDAIASSSNVKTLNIAFYDEKATDINTVTIPSETNLTPDAPIYNTSGQMVGSYKMFDKLPHGVYIVGGKKIAK